MIDDITLYDKLKNVIRERESQIQETLMSGALESSNTDITNEMVSMMRTQQAFNGNARIMQTSVDITRRLME